MTPEDIARRHLGDAASLTKPAGQTDPALAQNAITELREKFPREALRQTLQAGGLPDPILGNIGLVDSTNAPLYDQSYPMANQQITDSTNDPLNNNTVSEPISEQIVQGAYFSFPQEPDPSGELWGNIGQGPNGYDWNKNGSPLFNSYVPAFFGSDRPPVLNFPPIVTEGEFRARHLLGFERIINKWPDFSNVFKAYYEQAIDAVESAFGGVIYPRIILTDGTNRGFVPGQDFDWEERKP